MKTRRASAALAFMLLPTLAEAAFHSEDDKIPVLVMPSEVTVDGEERPALGRSFTDTLAGGLLRCGGFSVIDSPGGTPGATETAKGPSEGPPGPSASRFGQLTGVRFVYVPRLVVEDDFLKMTVKKVRVTDGAVLAVYETEARGERAAMFTLADNLLEQIYAELTLERAGKSAAERRLRKAGETPAEPDPVEPAEAAEAPELPSESTPGTVAESAPPQPVEAAPAEAAPDARPAPLAMAAKKPAKRAPATLDIGTVTSVNQDYAFCILAVPEGTVVSVGDELRVLIDDPLVPMVKLRVSKIDGRQAVAERVSGATMDRMAPGQRAFRINPSDE